MSRKKEVKTSSGKITASKVLIIIHIVLSIICSAAILFLGYFMLSVFYFIPTFVGAIMLIIGIAQIIGIILGIYAYTLISKKEFKKAGTLSIISGLLPPIGVLAWIAGIFLLIEKKR
jgi:hypothetical protein